MSVRITRFEIRDAQGELIAIHVRRDPGDSPKRFVWERPDGTSGLNGLPTAQLPLYGSEDVAGWSPREPIILVEGEKSRDALKLSGFNALATVTGAASCPELEPLGVLRGRDAILWPDADGPGREHIRKLAKRLLFIARSVHVFEWADAPEHGDAADYLVSGAEAAEQLRDRIRGARPASGWLAAGAAAPLGCLEPQIGNEHEDKPRNNSKTARRNYALVRASMRRAAVDMLKSMNFTPKQVLEITRGALSKSAGGSPKPLQGRELALVDPEPWPAPVNGAALADEIAATFLRYIVLPRGAEIAMALWTLQAHAHDAAQVSAILALISTEKRCGKSTATQLLGAMVPRPLTASNLTPAVLFRAVENYGPTLLVDEADTFLRECEDLRGILNAGHLRATAVVPRCVGDEHEIRMFSTWCPKVIAMIGRLPGTLEDRSIVVQLRRKPKGATVARLRLDRLKEFDPLRRQAWRWGQDHMRALQESDPSVPDSLHDRAQDNWRSLLAIADALGGDWPARARQAALALAGGAPESDSAGEMILADMRTLFDGRNTTRLSSDAIVKALAEREDRPWGEWKMGRPLTVIQLARLLKRFDITPRTIRLDNGTRLKGYDRESFEDAWNCYLSATPAADPLPPDNAGSMRVEGDSLPVTSRVGVTDEEFSEGLSSEARHGVTGQNDLTKPDGIPPGPLHDFLDGLSPGVEQ